MYWQGIVCSDGSQRLGWEGKEIQIGGVGRQGHWRGMLKRGMVVARSQAGKVWLKDYQDEPSWWLQGQDVAHWATVKMLN